MTRTGRSPILRESRCLPNSGVSIWLSRVRLKFLPSKSLSLRMKLLVSLAAGVLLALLSFFGGIMQFIFGGVGGVPPGYPAADHDKFLTEKAATAKPLLAALREFHARWETYPASIEEVRRLVPTLPNEVNDPTAVNGWSYSCLAGGVGFKLRYRLGWDPNLIYEWDGHTARWIFFPGDGTEEREIRLEP